WPGVEATGWLARPPDHEPEAALLILGPEPWTPVDDAQMPQLIAAAARGFVALMLDGTRLDRPALGLSTAGLLVRNQMRGVEYLQARREVDRTRIGILA